MPIYTYEPEEAEGGEPVERVFNHPPPEKIKVAGQWYQRAAVEPVAIVGLKPAPSQGDEVLRGYYGQECTQGSRFRSRFDAETIKRAWRDDRLSGAEIAADNGSQEASLRMVECQSSETE